ATAAWEMLESGRYIVPTFNAKLRVDKPALLYWLQVFAYATFGVNEFAARLPSALAAILAVCLCYELGRRMFNAATGFLGGLIVACTPMLCGAARFANPDSLLNALTLWTLVIFWLGYEKPRTWWFVAMGAASGLAVLAKGPVGLVLPCAIVFVFLLWEGKLRVCLHRGVGWMLLAWCLVALPWYIWVALETKADFLRGFLMNHNVNRFLSPMEHHDGSPLYFPAVLLVGFAPWSIFLGLALWYGGWSMMRRPWARFEKTWATLAEAECNSAAGYRFLLVWIGVYLVFFSLSATKLPNYVLPVATPCALLTARFFDRWRRREIAPARWLMPAGLVCLALVGVGTATGLLVASGALSGPIAPKRMIPGLEGWAVIGLAPLLAAAAAWWFLRRGRRDGAVISMTIGTLVFLGPLAAWASAIFNDVKAPQPLVEAAEGLRRDRDLRVGTLDVEYLPSLNFYVQRDIMHLATEHDALAFLRYPDISRGAVGVFLFVPAATWDKLAANAPNSCRELGRHQDLYRHQEVVLVANDGRTD
ncbi:MAG: glycosyltransferase family 39 protein, partial [Planctomycetes bacterium]|nr:glycosyltransferase family 39 protein [Planctomycetota bacterium]